MPEARGWRIATRCFSGSGSARRRQDLTEINAHEDPIHRLWSEERVHPLIGKPLVNVITGMRRSGKSSIVRLIADFLLATGTDPARVVFINMESMAQDLLRDFGELQRFVGSRRKEAGSPLSLFFDEIQEIPNWERAVNSFLADGDADPHGSGSNSKLLSGELASLLSARCVELPIQPLTLGEYRSFRSPQGADVDLFPAFLRFGGFPGLNRVAYEDEAIFQYRSALTDSVLLKDVVMRNAVRDVGLLRSLLLFLAGDIGNVFSARSIADFVKKERRSLGVETIYNYPEYLESAFVVHRVRRYDLRGQASPRDAREVLSRRHRPTPRAPRLPGQRHRRPPGEHRPRRAPEARMGSLRRQASRSP